MDVLNQFGITHFTTNEKSDIIKGNWITTEEGNHIYIDDDGNAKGGSEAYEAYQSESREGEEKAGSGGNTATRGHRDEILFDNWGRFDEEKVASIITDETGLSHDEAVQAGRTVNGFTQSFVSGGGDFRAIRKSQALGEPNWQAQMLERFIELSPKWDGGELYRGIQVPKDIAKKIISDAKDGKELSQFGTSSWGSDEKEANNRVNYDENPGIIFRTSGTKQGTSIRHLSAHPEENEVLISQNARWVATSVTKAGKNDYGSPIYIIDCEEV